MKILFLCAHPDDLEICVGAFIYKLNKKHEVFIVSATRGEWGTVNSKLKGKWLAKIRENELREAASINGVDPHRVEFLDYLDGGIDFKEPIISEIGSYIIENNFDIIFAPEYYFTYYFHPDHMNLGKIVIYTIMKKIKKNKPKLYLYHSIYNNKFLKVDMLRTHKAIMKHRTQILIIGIFIASRPIFNILNGLFYGKTMFAEAVRQVNFKKEMRFKLPLFHRMIYHLFEIGKIIEHPWRAENEEEFS